MPIVFTAGNARDRDPFATWVESLAEAFVPLETRKVTDAPFAGRIVQSRTGDIRLSRLQASPHRVMRRPHFSPDAAEDTVFVNLQLSGAGITTQHGRDVRSLPFDIAIADTAYRYEIGNRQGFDLISLAIPRRELPNGLMKAGGLPLSQSATGRDFARMIVSYVDMVLGEAAKPVHLGLLSQHIIDLINIAAQEIAGWHGAGSKRETKVALVVDYMRQNCADPLLTARKVGHAFGISERYIGKLLSDGGSFGERLTEMRLARARRILADPATSSLSITTIALDCGFSDPSFFSRCFKARYGETPSEYRHRNIRQ